MYTNPFMNGQRESSVCLQAGQGRPAECVWMQAGVVNFHMCDKNGGCTGCSFDRSMRNFMACQNPVKGRRPTPAWPERMRAQYPGFMKPCIFFLDGSRDSFTACRRNYDCDDCPIGLELEYRPMLRAIRSMQ